jgi:hypothetical protein
MGKSLQRLEKKKLDLGMKKLGDAGIDVQRWLAMLDADNAEMQRLAAAWPIFSQPCAYDAVALFGFGSSGEEPLPDGKSGEIVIRYGGWSLRELCANAVIREKNLMWEQDWYHKYQWSSEKLPAGIYRMRIPVPHSNRKNFAEQEAMLPSGEQFAPIVLVATAMLAHRLQAGENLLKNDWTRCKEQTADGYRVVLYWGEGRLVVDVDWDDRRDGGLWSSSVRTS